ncbi:MAG TPA: hypothetical protein VGP64_07375 [Polyangia bacterium]|jgi:hypothetical protein
MRRVASTAALVFGAALCIDLGLAAPERAARADDGTPSGVSVGAGFDVFHDGTITDAYGDSIHGRAAELGLDVLANVGDLAVGGVVAGSPDILGDGRLLVGGRLGIQPTFGTTRVQVLAELGIHRYTHLDEGLFSTSTPDFFSTPYIGAQVGITRELVKDGMFEYGVAFMVRQDIGRQTFVHMDGSFLGGEAPPPTTLTVGGTMIGASFTLGVRLDRANVAAARTWHGIER